MASPLLLTNARKGDTIMAWDESEHPRDSDGKFTRKIDPEILKALCKAFGVKNDSNARKNLKSALYKSSKYFASKSVIKHYKKSYRIDSPPTDITNSAIRIPAKHYYRLSAMWSDYNIGTCKPFECSEGIYFNVDNSIYVTRGEYPWFYVVRALRFQNTHSLERFLKRRWNK